MTVQVHTAGPGVESWRSSRYAATVNGTAAYVYGVERVAEMNTYVWSKDEVVEQSWFNFGTDEVTTVVVTLVSGAPIRDVDVYPGDAGVHRKIASGTLTLTVPANVRLRVEINGDRKNALHIFASPLKRAVPASRTDFTTLARAVSGVNIVTNELTFDEPHGFADGERVLLVAEDSLPTDAGGAIKPYEGLYVKRVDGGTIQLAATEGGGALDLLEGSAEALSVVPMSWTDTANALYFPAGVHAMGRLFDVGSNTTIYLDEGAVVTGSFDLSQTDGISFQGAGILDGSYADWSTDVAPFPFSTKRTYTMFLGDDGTKYLFDNECVGLTVVNTVFNLGLEGIYSWRNVHLISCWNPNSDGFDLSGRSESDYSCEVVDCFALAGDDACKFQNDRENLRVTGSFFITVANSCLQGYYFAPGVGPGLIEPILIRGCDLMTLGVPDSPESDNIWAVIKSWVDGWDDQSDHGQFNVTIEDVKVWGPCPQRLISLGNREYPFLAGPRDQAGQISDWTIRDLWCEYEPGQKSNIIGRDEANTPHDLAFINLTLGGVVVTDDNVATYFDIDPEVYNVTFVEQEPESPSVAPTTGVYERTQGAVAAWWQSEVEPLADNPVLWSTRRERPKDWSHNFGVRVQFSTAQQVTLGRAGERIIRHTGFVDAVVMADLKATPHSIYRLADIVRARALATNPTGVVFRMPSVTELLRDNAHNQVTVRIPFYVEEVA